MKLILRSAVAAANSAIRSSIVVLALIGSLVLDSDQARAASTISYAGNGQFIAPWGPNFLNPVFQNQSYGQIFTAPENHLVDYTLNVFAPSLTPTSFQFVSQIYTWDGSGTIGSALYTSSQQAIADSVTSYNYLANVNLTVGQQYIALVTNQPDGVSLGGLGYGNMEMSDFPGDGFAYTINTPNAGPWLCVGCDPGFNVAFEANFLQLRSPSAVPEPSTWAMIILGFAGVGFMGYRRSRKDQGVALAA